MPGGLSGEREEGRCLGTSRDFRALSSDLSLERDRERVFFSRPLLFFPEDLSVERERDLASRLEVGDLLWLSPCLLLALPEGKDTIQIYNTALTLILLFD